MKSNSSENSNYFTINDNDILRQVKVKSRVNLPHRQISMQELFTGKGRGGQPTMPVYSGFSSRPPDALFTAASRSAGDIITALSGGTIRLFSMLSVRRFT